MRNFFLITTSVVVMVTGYHAWAEDAHLLSRRGIATEIDPTQGEEPVMVLHGTNGEISKNTKRKMERLKNDLLQGRIYQHIDDALDAQIRLARYKLVRAGERELGDSILAEWEGHWRGEIVRLTEGRGIGDHKPLSKWLADKYTIIEFVLGKDVCHNLRLDDIKTLNHAIPVVVKCVDDVDVAEFYLHFVADDIYGYRGLFPVISYWVTNFACVGFSWGTGFLFCAPIAMGDEFLVKNYAAPKLNEPLWKRVCKKGDY